jgi:hypothetical protein
MAWCTVVSSSNHIEAATHYLDSSRYIYKAYSHLLWTAIRQHAASCLTANQQLTVIATKVRAELVSACDQIKSRSSPLTKSRWSPAAICWCTCTCTGLICRTARRGVRYGGGKKKKSKLIGLPVRLLLLLTSLFPHRKN